MSVAAFASALLALRLAGFTNDGTTSIEADTFYRITPKSDRPAYYLCIKTEERPTIVGGDWQQLAEADVFATDKKTILQRIRFGPAAPNDPDAGDGNSILAGGVDQADFNFDGYLDFEGWLWEMGGSGGCPSKHYIFDPVTHRYRSSPQLDALISTAFDDREKVVRSYGGGGGMYSNASTYRWIGKKLILMREVKRSRDEKGYFTEYSDYSDASIRKCDAFT